ncbi:MAG: ABC transporter ATP-binding protein [Lachnospiraceae bacterium]|nr:ABC transporter ATP-binding protein [Lachnospiraceae bacterium]
MSDTAIRVSDVSKMYKLYDRNRDRLRDALGLARGRGYKEHYALHHLSFEIKQGECVGIIGTNGAGKSTTLKIITGVLSPTEGELEINGRISALLELGAGFNQEFTGLENVYLNGMMIGYTREEIDKRLPDILEFADIGEYINQPVKSYSSGMFVRLAFAVAINIDPEILIVDEALSVGDVFFQAKCYKKFEDFKKMGKTILFVSHDLSSISHYCDRVVLLDGGHMLSEGTPKEMIDLYKRVLARRAGSRDGQAALEAKEDGEKNQDELWKSHFAINPEVDEYGNGAAHIIDFCIEDENGTMTESIEKGSEFTIRSKVLFDEDITEPIFTYTFKNIRGEAITGTNTLFEGVDTGTAKKGSVYVASFRQVMNLQGGEYLLSISCTGYRDGEHTVYHRLYDVLNVTVVAEHNTVGFYDMFSKISVEKLV